MKSYGRAFSHYKSHQSPKSEFGCFIGIVTIESPFLEEKFPPPPISLLPLPSIWLLRIWPGGRHGSTLQTVGINLTLQLKGPGVIKHPFSEGLVWGCQLCNPEQSPIQSESQCPYQ